MLLFVISYVVRGDRLERYPANVAGLVGLVIGAVVDRIAFNQVCSSLNRTIALTVCILEYSHRERAVLNSLNAVNSRVDTDDRNGGRIQTLRLHCFHCAQRHRVVVSDDAVELGIVLMDCNYPQYYDTPDYVEFYWMHLAGCNAFALCEYLMQAHEGIMFRAEKAASLLRLIVSQYANRQPIAHAEQSRLLYSILCYLMPGARDESTTEENGPVQRVIGYIDTHLAEDLSLKRLAAQVYLSPAHLIRLFRAQTQHAPHEYIVLARMDRAKYLLKTTALPVKTIALEVGYRSESSFTNAFVGRVGISPGQFRRLPLG